MYIYNTYIYIIHIYIYNTYIYIYIREFRMGSSIKWPVFRTPWWKASHHHRFSAVKLVPVWRHGPDDWWALPARKAPYAWEMSTSEKRQVNRDGGYHMYTWYNMYIYIYCILYYHIIWIYIYIINHISNIWYHMITYMCVALCTYFYICVSLLLYDMISAWAPTIIYHPS